MMHKKYCTQANTVRVHMCDMATSNILVDITISSQLPPGDPPAQHTRNNLTARHYIFYYDFRYI